MPPKLVFQAMTYPPSPIAAVRTSNGLAPGRAVFEITGGEKGIGIFDLHHAKECKFRYGDHDLCDFKCSCPLWQYKVRLSDVLSQAHSPAAAVWTLLAACARQAR